MTENRKRYDNPRFRFIQEPGISVGICRSPASNPELYES